MAHGGVEFVALGVDAFGGMAQRQFAQGQQIAFLEEVLGGALIRALGDIDLAVGQPLQQLFGRNVDQRDFVGGVEHLVGNGFAHPDARQFGHLVVDAFQMLDIQRGIDVDAGIEQFLDILPALRVARTRRIGMGEFVHQDQAGPALQRTVEVELPDLDAAMVDLQKRQNRQPLGESCRFAAAVMFDNADHDVAAALQLTPGFGQHGVGLAHTGRGAEEDLEMTAPVLFRLIAEQLQQFVGVRAAVSGLVVLSGLGSHFSFPSSLIFSSSTLTRDSPNTPNVRSLVEAAMAALTASTLT